MAGNIKGIIVEIGGDTSGLKKALDSVTKTTNSLQKELSAVNKSLKFDPKNTTLLKQKQELLQQSIKGTKDRLEQLKEAQRQADQIMKNGGDISQENYRALQREIAETEHKLKQLQIQASKWTQASEGLRDFSNKTKALGETLGKVGSTLTQKVTMPIVALGTASIVAGNNFEAQMSRVQAIAGATGEELKSLTDLAIELGAKTSFSAMETAQGMENLASAGFNTNEIMEAMPGLLDLAASSGSELATASEIAANTIRQFGLEAKETTHIADVLAEASARTNAQVEDMGEAMKYAGPSAHDMGISMEELAAAIGIMSDAGIKGSQAGTSLRGALSRMAKPTKQMRDEMKKLGITFFNSDGTAKSLGRIIGELQTKFEGLTQEQRQHAIVTIFGQNALSGMSALINRGAEDLNVMTESFKNCDGAAQRMADIMLNNTSGAIEEMRGSLETAAIVIQQQLAPYIIAIAKKVTELVNKFVNLDDKTKKVILALLGIAAVVGPIILIIAKFITAISVISGALATITGAIGTITAGLGFFGGALALITSPVGILITLVGVLIAAFVTLKNNGVDVFATIQTMLSSIVGFVQTYIMPIVDQLIILIKNVFNTIVNVITEIQATAQPMIQEFLTWLSEFYNSTIKGIIDNLFVLIANLIEILNLIWVTFIQPLISYFVDKLKPNVENAINGVIGVIKFLLAAVTDIVGRIIALFRGITDFLLGVFTGDWQRAWEGIKLIFKTIIESLPSIFKAMINALIDKINGFLNSLNGIKIPDWVPGVGGMSFSIPLIPKLANGGIVTSPTLAMIGEGRSNEAVIPLDRRLTKYLAEGLREAGATRGDITLNFYPQEMSEAELENAFRYVNRRFGVAL